MSNDEPGASHAALPAHRGLGRPRPDGRHDLYPAAAPGKEPLAHGRAGTAAADHEGAFQLAYDACRKTCLALILATGLRPKGEASHAVTFEAASAVAGNFGGRQIVVYASDLRFVRHGTEYRAETVSAEDAQDAIALGEELVEQLAPRIEQILEST